MDLTTIWKLLPPLAITVVLEWLEPVRHSNKSNICIYGYVWREREADKPTDRQIHYYLSKFCVSREHWQMQDLENTKRSLKSISSHGKCASGRYFEIQIWYTFLYFTFNISIMFRIFFDIRVVMAIFGCQFNYIRNEWQTRKKRTCLWDIFCVFWSGGNYCDILFVP